MSFQGTLGERLGRWRIPRSDRLGLIVGVVGRFRLGYERGLFLSSAIRVLDRSSLRLSVTPRGVEGLFGRTETRRLTVEVRSERVTVDLGLAVVGGGVIRRFGRAGRCSIRGLGGDILRLGLELRLGGDALRLGLELRLGGDALRLGLELRLGGDALRLGGELRFGGDALRFGGELRFGGDALRLGGELRFGGEALRLGGELRLGGDALRFGGELRLGGEALRLGGELRFGGDALRLGGELRLGGDALRLGVDRDRLAPLLPLRSLLPPSIEAETCDTDTPLSSETDPLATASELAAIQNVIAIAAAMVVMRFGQEESCADIALPPDQGSPGYAVWSPRAVAPWARTPLGDSQFRLTPEKKGSSADRPQPNRQARRHTGGVDGSLRRRNRQDAQGAAAALDDLERGGDDDRTRRRELIKIAQAGQAEFARPVHGVVIGKWRIESTGLPGVGADRLHTDPQHVPLVSQKL